MNKLFVLLMMVFALSVGMTTSVQASGVGNDFDVGYTINDLFLPAADMQHFYMDAVIPLTNAEPMANVQTTCEAHYLAVLRSQKQPYKFWEGGSTKASLCKAIVEYSKDTNADLPSTTYSFGRDIRRLLCEAKA